MLLKLVAEYVGIMSQQMIPYTFEYISPLPLSLFTFEQERQKVLNNLVC